MEHGAWSMEHGARSREHGAWGVGRGVESEERGARSEERGAGSGGRRAWGGEWRAGSRERGAWSMGRGAWSGERLGKLVALASLPMKKPISSAGSRCHFFPPCALSTSSHFLPFTRHRGSAARLLAAPTFLPLTRHSPHVTRHPLPVTRYPPPRPSAAKLTQVSSFTFQPCLPPPSLSRRLVTP